MPLPVDGGVDVGVGVAVGVTDVLGVGDELGVVDEFGVGDELGVNVGVVSGTPWVDPLPGHINPAHISPAALLIIPATGWPTALRASMPLTSACPPAMVMAERVNTSPAARTVPATTSPAQNAISKM